MVRVEDLVRRKGPLTERQVKLVKKWIEEDWESHDAPRELVDLMARLVATVEKARR